MRPKPCPVCGIKFTKDRPLQVVCSPKCAYEYNKPRQVDKRVKQMRKDKEYISLPEAKATAKRHFQHYIRLRDEGLNCISCGKESAKWDASHFYKAEVFTGLIFDEENCHKSCSYCNQHLDGNLIEYRKGLIKKIGRLNVELLEARANFSRIKKYTREDYLEIAETYKEKVKQLKKPAA